MKKKSSSLKTWRKYSAKEKPAGSLIWAKNPKNPGKTVQNQENRGSETSEETIPEPEIDLLDKTIKMLSLNNFFKRLFSGIGYIVLYGRFHILAGKYFYGILFLVVTLLTLYEFYKLYTGTPYPVPKISGMAAGGLIFMISFLCFSGLADC